jgi:hypothetical protein
MVDDIVITFPKHYKPLPDGYSVVWEDCIEHYVGHGPNETESDAYCDRNMARRWCFANYEKSLFPFPSQ